MDAALIKGLASKLPQSQIAEIIGVSPKTVRVRRAELGLAESCTEPTWQSWETIALLHYRAQGMSFMQCARILRKSKNAVVGKCHRLDLTSAAA